jgi:uncharacterized protein YxeA
MKKILFILILSVLTFQGANFKDIYNLRAIGNDNYIKTKVTYIKKAPITSTIMYN